MSRKIDKNIKKDFKYLRDNPEVVFLNSSATSLKPDIFVNKLSEIYSNRDTSYGRGYTLDINKEDNSMFLYNETLKKVAKHINANVENVIPTYGTTDFLNKAIWKLVLNLNDGDEIILGKLEHASNVSSWIEIIKELKKDIKIKWYELKDWKIDYDHLSTLITNKTKIIAIAHVYNTSGAKNNLVKIRNSIGKDVILFVDGAQAFGHIPIDVKESSVDYYIFGTHKAFGPHSLGFAYIKDLNKVKRPWNYGGGNNLTYDENNITYKEGVDKFIPGTRDVPGVIAFATSMDYIEDFGIQNIEKHNLDLKKYAEEKVGSLSNIKIINKGVESSNLFFEVKNVAGEDVGYSLAQEKIIVRHGHSCVKMSKDFQPHKAIRASFHIYNTREDVDKLYNAIKEGGDFLDGLFNKRPTSKFC